MSIASRDDEVFPPAVSFAGVPGGDEVVLQDGCAADRSGHLTMPASPRVVDVVLNAVGPASAVVPRCVAADGVVGPIAPVPPRHAP